MDEQDRMKTFLLAGVFLAACALPAAAAESGYTLRATDLRARPFVDAPTIATLPERTAVEIATRQGAWMEIKTREGSKGWIRMLSVRLGNPDQKASGGNILSAIGVGNRPRPQTTATVTTGVRGFSEAELKDAKPNPAEVDKMESFAADKAQATAFAANGKLGARQIAYFDEQGKPVEKKK
jgi:hypothetical protein